jgi:hypothetical protein
MKSTKFSPISVENQAAIGSRFNGGLDLKI